MLLSSVALAYFIENTEKKNNNIKMWNIITT